MKKIGIIDIGSNSVRLVIVEVGEEHSFRIYDEVKETVRLGEQADETHILQTDRMKKALQALQMFKTLCDSIPVEEIIPVATAAVRNAENGNLFLEKVALEIGIQVRVLSGEEEAHYAYWGAVNSLDIESGLIMDIGGGSTELIWMENRQLRTSISLPIGALTLTGQFDLENKVSDRQEQALKDFLFAQFRAVPWLSELSQIQLVGVGGTFRNLGKIDRNRKHYPLDITHNYCMTAVDLQQIYTLVKSKNLSQRKKIAGLSRERADIFVGALAAIVVLMEYVGITGLIISGSGIREGLIYDYLLPNSVEPTNVLDFSIKNLLIKYHLNEPHSKHIYKLTQTLYTALQPLHGITEDLSKVLKTAAMLHDCGIQIRYYNHHEHSFYVILHSGVNGLTHRELVMSAFIAASHRKDPVSVHIPRFHGIISKEDLVMIQKVGVLLRIAESLDRGMNGNIKDVHCKVTGNAVVIQTITQENPELAIYNAMTAEKQFKKVYGKTLVIR